MSAGPKAFMLDSNVFSRVCDGVLPLPAKAGRRFLVTGVQVDECRRAPCPTRRADLLRVIEEVDPELCRASSLCFGIEGAGLGQSLWNDGSGRFEDMLAQLKALDRKQKTEAQHLNQIRDIVIAETALKLGATLVTDDIKLRQVFQDFGGNAVPSAALA